MTLPNAVPAGLPRRVGAVFLDLLIAIIPVAVIGMLPGVFIPLDVHANAVVSASFPFVFAALFYIYFGYAFLPNSYGRYVMGVRVADAETGRRPRFGQALKRALTVGLWPVEGLLIAFSRTGQRLGDRWAGTQVVRYSPTAPLWRRAAPCMAGLAMLYGALQGVTPVITGRMRIAAVAREQVRRELGVAQAGAARRVEILDNEGMVTVELADGDGARVRLVRSGDGWTARRVERIPAAELGGGFLIQQGNTTIHANP